VRAAAMALGRSTAHSSPPRRATVSDARSAPCRQPAHLAQHGVTGLVPQRVVDVREAIQVHQAPRQGPARALRGAQRLPQTVVEERAIGQAG